VATSISLIQNPLELISGSTWGVDVDREKWFEIEKVMRYQKSHMDASFRRRDLGNYILKPT